MRIAGFAESEEVFKSFKSSGARLSENYISRNDESHHRAGIWSAIQSKLAADSLRSLAHSPEAKMAVPAFRQENGSHANSVVTHAQRKILRIGDYDFYFARRSVLTRIANRFISNPKDLIADDWVHISGTTGQRKADLHRFVDLARTGCFSQIIGEIVRFYS